MERQYLIPILSACLVLVSLTVFPHSDAFTVSSSSTSLKHAQHTPLHAKHQHCDNLTRRGWISQSLAVITAGTLGTAAALAADDTTASTAPTNVYFGVGCFWHIQHEFVEAERRMLGRNDQQLSSRTGYAGGKSVGIDGQVCYHNLRGIADYGKLGHGEVVGLNLPSDGDQIVDFGRVYFSLFNPRTKDRVDPQDKGPEYRSLIGLPGGVNHPQFTALQTVAAEAGFKLQEGKGNDPDTLGKQLVFVYDTAKFPFYQAEVYHQFHNDFQSPAYGKAYNSLADAAFEDGRLCVTGCPDRV